MEIIINIDGGSRGNPGPGASAYVIKNSTGQIIAQEGRFFKECTNNQAEFTALLMALNKAAELKASSLNIRSDSQLLVRQYLGQYKIKNPQLQLIMAEIKTAASKFKKLSINHVPREQNKEADALCNKTMDAALKKPSLKTEAVLPKQVTANKACSLSKTAGNPVVKTSGKPAAKTKKEDTVFEQLELFDLNNL